MIDHAHFLDAAQLQLKREYVQINQIPVVVNGLWNASIKHIRIRSLHGVNKKI